MVRRFTDIQSLKHDPSLNPGARNAVEVCLKVQPGERVVLIADERSLPIASSLAGQLDRVGARTVAFVLEDYASRPLTSMPTPVLEALSDCRVSFYTARAKRGELKARMEMTRVINRRKIRHAHMVNITPRIMRQGMRADFLRVDRLSQTLLDKARGARRIYAESAGGTRLEAEFSPRLRWIKTSGIIGTDKWGNLPGGEIFTSPDRVDGTFVADGVVGDYLCDKYGDLRDSPLRIRIENSRIVELESSNQQLLEDFAAYTSTDSNSNRVGEFAIGTNLSVKDVIGNILQDEKIPGIHVAFGHPYSEHTGQTWKSTTHIDCVGRSFDIWIDDEQIMESGRFRIH